MKMKTELQKMNDCKKMVNFCKRIVSFCLKENVQIVTVNIKPVCEKNSKGIKNKNIVKFANEIISCLDKDNNGVILINNKTHEKIRKAYGAFEALDAFDRLSRWM